MRNRTRADAKRRVGRSDERRGRPLEMRASSTDSPHPRSALTLDARAATVAAVVRRSSQTPATTCHATCDVTFTFCAMVSDVPRTRSTSPGRTLRARDSRWARTPGLCAGSTVGDPPCTAAGCDRQKLSLTFQSASLNATWDAGAGCEVTDTPRRCPLRRVPRPEIAPAARVTAKVTCENTLLPCTNAKVSATVDFYAKVAWPSCPSPPGSDPPAEPPRLPDPRPRLRPPPARSPRRVGG